MAGGVEQQSHLTGALDLGGEQALVLGAGAGDAASDDLAALGDVVAQDVRALVIKRKVLVRAEAAELAARGKLFLEGHLTQPPRPYRPA